MIFIITYQNKKDSADTDSNFTRSFFADHQSDPSPEMVRKLVDLVSHGDFGENTIKVKEWLEFDAEAMRKQGVKLHKFS